MFLNVNGTPGPVLPGGLKLKVTLGLGDSFTLSPWPTRRSTKGPRESSGALGTWIGGMVELLACSLIELGTEVAGFRGILSTWVTPESTCSVGEGKNDNRVGCLHTFLCKKNNPKSFFQVIKGDIITLRSTRSLRLRRRGAQVEGECCRGSAIKL